jgi:uncharacterized protein (TIGR02996 family)
VRQEEAFLRAIAESSEDNTHRLVYADWLEEHDQPERAELIRVQIALADPPEDHAAYRALRAQEAALLDGHGKEWFGPLKKLEVQGWVLRRGLVGHVTMPARKFLDNAEQLFALAPVHTVKLTTARPVIAELGACPLLARLSGLDLAGNKLQAAEVRSLLSPRLSGLRRLDLSDNPLGPGGVQALTASAHLTGLRRLALRNVEMGEGGARALSGHIDYPLEYAASVNLAGLVALDLRENMIYEEGVAELTHSPHLAGLTELSLSPIWGKDSEALQESRYLRNLTTLRISGDFSEGIPLLLHSPFVKRLRVLDLSDTGATERDAEEIADCRHLGELQHLNLGHNAIGDDGVRALASRARLPRLRWLDLWANGITAAGVRALCDSPLLEGVRELDLSFNDIDDDGAEALAACPHLPQLYGLILCDNAMTNTGALALTGSPLMGQLEGLYLAGNPIKRKGTTALSRAAGVAGLLERAGNDFWVDPQRSRREPSRETE